MKTKWLHPVGNLILIPFALVGYAVVFVIVWTMCLAMDFEEWLTK